MKENDIHEVMEILKKNVATVREIIRVVLGDLPDPKLSPASAAMKYAIVTAPESIPRESCETLNLLIGKYLAAR